MEEHYFDIGVRLAAAWSAGALIGIERNYAGRPAGLRTHALVGLSSAMLMLVSAYQIELLGKGAADAFNTDPTRLAQGIMTGIGFLGAGVIFKDGLTVRGLTTAASIWMTAALGILFGIGFYFPALVVTAATLATLTIIRLIDDKLPTQHFAMLMLKYEKGRAIPEPDVRKYVASFGYHVLDMSYKLDAETGVYEYRMTIKSTDETAMEKLASSLNQSANVAGYSLAPKGD